MVLDPLKGHQGHKRSIYYMVRGQGQQMARHALYQTNYLFKDSRRRRIMFVYGKDFADAVIFPRRNPEMSE